MKRRQNENEPTHKERTDAQAQKRNGNSQKGISRKRPPGERRRNTNMEQATLEEKPKPELEKTLDPTPKQLEELELYLELKKRKFLRRQQQSQAEPKRETSTRRTTEKEHFRPPRETKHEVSSESYDPKQHEASCEALEEHSSSERRSLSPPRRERTHTHGRQRRNEVKREEYIPPDPRKAATPHGWQRSECQAGHPCRTALCYTHKTIRGAVWDRSCYPKPYFPTHAKYASAHKY